MVGRRAWSWRAAFAFALSWAPGCAVSHEGADGATHPDVAPSDPVVPFIQIRADLDDESTNVGQGPFKVSYTLIGPTLDDATVGRLSAKLSLRTWPEGAVVAAVVTNGPVTDMTMKFHNPGWQAVVEIAPSSVIEDRWYSIQFGSPEQGVESFQSFDGDVWGVRVRPGSHPAVRLIQFCGGKFKISFSESVTTTSSGDLFTVVQKGQSLGCGVYQTLPQDLLATCDSYAPGPVTVTVAADQAQGAGGTPLAAGSWTFDTTMLPAIPGIVEPSCVGYPVPLNN